MAITKIWAVKDDLRRVLNYIENPDKTKEELGDGLKEVLAYTTQGYKTNEKEYITGINCEPSTSLKQMMNTKLSYNKMDGRLAFHAVQSFKPGEIFDVDSVLAYARTLDQMKSGLEDIGYVVDLTGKHWTLKHPQSQRKFRFYKLARDGRYDEDHIMERINNNYLFPMQPVKDIVPCKEYHGDHTKLKGIKALYIRYCFELGIIRPKGKRQKYPSPQLRKDLIYMDKITNENTFVGKHNLETIEDVLAFKVSLNKEIESWMNQRRSIYNKIKRTRDPNLKKQLEMDRDTLTSKIAHGKKEIKICEDIEKRVPDIQDKLKMVNALEDERIQTQKEYERSLNL